MPPGGETLLLEWLNAMGLSRAVEHFEPDLANGYLFAEVLHRHGLLHSMDGLADQEGPAAKVGNLMEVQQPLLDLGVKFSSKIANELMTETKGAAVNLCYQLKLGLENATVGGAKPVMRHGQAEPVLLGSTIKSTRQSLSKYEAMQAEHFDALVKRQVHDPKQLAQALSLSRYTEHMIAQQKTDDEIDHLRQEQWEAMVQQRRQLELAKLHEGKRLMSEWQAEGYKKHGDNIRRRHEEQTAKLRFELTVRSKSARRLAATSAIAADDLSHGIHMFEATLKRLQSDASGGGDEFGADLDAESRAAIRAEVGAAEHLARLAKLLPSGKSMDTDSATYLSRLRGRRLEEEASRKEREMRRRKVRHHALPLCRSSHLQVSPTRR